MPVALAAVALIFIVMAQPARPVAGHGEKPADPVPADSAPPVVVGATLHPSAGWPVWLKDYRTSARTDETSGIAYLGKDAQGARCFFLADDVGFLHYCRVFQEGDTGSVALRLERVRTDASLIDLLAEHEKWDFEALVLDLPRPRAAPAPALPDTVRAMLAIEGRGYDFRDRTRVIAIRLVRTLSPARIEAANGGSTWRVEGLGDAIPGAHFWHRQVAPNRGLKGLAIGQQYLFLGLESLARRSEPSSRGTTLFLYDRARNKAAQVSTRPLGIRSICGMDAIGDTVTVLVDRNAQSICVVRWDREVPGRVTACYRFPLDLPAPGGFRYAIPSVEGLAVDDEGEIWCVTDPWAGHYQALGAVPETLRVYLAAEMPMMYRFPGESVWKTAGLTGLWEKQE
jgi:hypothetical protein